MGYWMNKVPRCRRIPDSDSLPGVRHPVLKLVPLTASPIVYWENLNGEILGPAEVTAEAQEGTRRWVCVECQGTSVWIRRGRLRSHPKLQTHGYASGCYTCKATRFWESIHGAVICGVCHPPANTGLVVNWLNCIEPASREER
jgi:hypothetical protein